MAGASDEPGRKRREIPKCVSVLIIYTRSGSDCRSGLRGGRECLKADSHPGGQSDPPPSTGASRRPSCRTNKPGGHRAQRLRQDRHRRWQATPRRCRQFIVETDKNGGIEATGHPTCKEGKLVATTTVDRGESPWKSALIGKGNDRCRGPLPRIEPDSDQVRHC